MKSNVEQTIESIAQLLTATHDQEAQHRHFV